MKYILPLLITVFLVSQVNAQNEYAYTTTAISEKPTKISSSTLSSEEKQMLIIADIKEDLARHLKYPDEMISYGLEGSCMLVVQLSKMGTVISFSIEDSLGSLFDKEIQDVIERKGKTDTNNSSQPGLRIKIPIQFRF